MHILAMKIITVCIHMLVTFSSYVGCIAGYCCYEASKDILNVIMDRSVCVFNGLRMSKADKHSSN